MTRRSLGPLAVMALALLSSIPLLAHHSVTAEFDSSKSFTVKATITKIEWVNPHTWIHVEIKKDDGAKEIWMVEGGSPNTLLRRGANKNTFPEGTEVVVDGYQARDHNEKRANARNVTFADGRKLFLGMTGTVAPDPEKFNNEKATTISK